MSGNVLFTIDEEVIVRHILSWSNSSTSIIAEMENSGLDSEPKSMVKA